MSTLLYHAVRRGLEHAPAMATKLMKRGDKPDEEPIEFPWWGQAIVISTVVAYVVVYLAASFSLEHVVVPLAIVETPSSAIALTTSSSSPETAPSSKDGAKDGLLETGGPQTTLVSQKPFTSSIRGTLRHLVEHGGFFARWRGFRALVVYNIAFAIVASMLSAVVKFPGCEILAAGAASALLANLHAAWTHKVISMPNRKSLWQSILPRSNWKVVALPAAIEASSAYVAVYMIGGFAYLLGFSDLFQGSGVSGGAQTSLFVLRLVALFVVIMATLLFIILPASATLARVEASILPEDQDTIVPFDRTFGGKVVPKVLGGTGSIGFVDAWKSFDWEARRRVIKTFVKAAAILIAINFVFFHVVLLELFAIMGHSLGKYMMSHKEEWQFLD